MRQAKVVLAITLFGAAAVGAAKPNATVVGGWQQVGGAGVIEFSAKGTVLIRTDEGALTGTYQFVDAGTIRFDLDGAAAAFGAFIVPAKVSQDELALSDGEGAVTHFRRIGRDVATRRVPRPQHQQKGGTR